MKRAKLLIMWAMVVSLPLILGCETERTTGPSEPTTIQGWITQGWSLYDSNDGEDAVDSFEVAFGMAELDLLEARNDSASAAETGNNQLLQDAITRIAVAVGQMTEAFTGMGWAIIGSFNEPAQAALVFSNALNLNPEYSDALAGFAVMLQIDEDWQTSNEKIASLLSISPQWSFSHDDVDYLDMRLMRAENHFFLAEYELSLQEALALNYLIDYQADLSEADFNLATIEGRAALIDLIEALDDLV